MNRRNFLKAIGLIPVLGPVVVSMFTPRTTQEYGRGWKVVKTYHTAWDSCLLPYKAQTRSGLIKKIVRLEREAFYGRD